MTNLAHRLDRDRLAIFLFHGVVGKSVHPVRNYTRKHLEKDAFAAAVRELCSRGRALSMEDVIGHAQNSEPYPPYSFVVSFDDGFENNYSVAAPVLADQGVPAIFYVTSGFVEHNSMSWIDRIEHCLEKAPPGSLMFPWTRAPCSFETAGDRIRLLDEIRAHVKKDPRIDVHAFAEDIFAQCGLEPVRQSRDPLDKKMSWDQVRALNESPDFIVGGHTHTHAVMSFLSPEELEREILTSLDLLQRKAGVSPRHYSYPEGLTHCYSPEVAAALKRHGVVCCPTAIDGLNAPGDGLFDLKRIMAA